VREHKSEELRRPIAMIGVKRSSFQVGRSDA
jgi:hypothetical protein